MQGYLSTEALAALPALGKGHLQEVRASPELSGTPRAPSAAGTAGAGTRSLTFPSQSSTRRVWNGICCS